MRAKATDTDWSLNSSPATPDTNTTGMKTMIVVKVEAETGRITSFTPIQHAVKTSAVSRFFLSMFSSTTIELSTSMPIPRANPDNDIRFSEIFEK